jgi:AcrR family transcriptional regulator
VPKAATDDTRTPRSDGHEGPRSRKGARTRARLIDAARTVFERDGFLTARIADIAATAGLSQGSFYHYFDSKEQIFHEVALAQEQRLVGAPVEPSDDDLQLTVEQTIRRDNRLYLERYRDAARLMGVIEQVSRYDERVNAARMATNQHFADKAEATIRRLQSEGLMDKKLHPRIAAEALGAMISRFAELWLVQGFREYDFDEVVDQLTLLCLNALGVPAKRRAPSRK